MNGFCSWLGLGLGLGLVIMAFTGAAWAGPEDGFGLAIGSASHDNTGKFTEGSFKGLEFDYTSSGLSLAIDYQFTLNDAFSLNILYQASSETVDSKDLSATDAGHGIVGLQLRLWFDALFVGGHVGSYSEVLTFEDALGEEQSISGSGTGYGAVVGIEGDGGLFLTGQVDFATIQYADAETDLMGTRIGYRWR